MEQKKPSVKIGSIGHVGYGKNDLNSAIETLLKEPHMANNSITDFAPDPHKNQRMTLSEQIMEQYERKKREEEMRWLEETGYYDALYAKVKQQIEETKAEQESINEK